MPPPFFGTVESLHYNRDMIIARRTKYINDKEIPNQKHSMYSAAPLKIDRDRHVARY